MWDLLRDPMWQFIGAVLALVAIVVTIFLYRKQSHRKQLSYGIVTRTPLLSVKEQIKGDLKILYNGEPVEKVYLVQIKMLNSGNTPILPTDYERSVGFSFGEEAKILTAEITETEPKSLKPSIKVDGKSVLLSSSLMNPDDSMILNVLVSRFGGQITVDGRIAGVKDIRVLTEGRRLGEVFLFVVGLALGFIAIFVVEYILP